MKDKFRKYSEKRKKNVKIIQYSTTHKIKKSRRNYYGKERI